MINYQLGFLTPRHRGLMNNTAHTVTQFVLANLFQARQRLMSMMGKVHPKYIRLSRDGVRHGGVELCRRIPASCRMDQSKVSRASGSLATTL